MPVLAVPEKNPRLVAFGRRLKAARAAAGLTQQAVADAAGFERASVAKYEAGLLDVSLTSLERLAAALGISPRELAADPDA